MPAQILRTSFSPGVPRLRSLADEFGSFNLKVRSVGLSILCVDVEKSRSIFSIGGGVIAERVRETEG